MVVFLFMLSLIPNILLVIFNLVVLYIIIFWRLSSWKWAFTILPAHHYSFSRMSSLSGKYFRKIISNAFVLDTLRILFLFNIFFWEAFGWNILINLLLTTNFHRLVARFTCVVFHKNKPRFKLFAMCLWIWCLREVFP